MEEAEDLLEYYLQRAATTQSEAERLLAGARDLEESIGVSLSARRFEVLPRVLAQEQCCLRVLLAACCALLRGWEARGICRGIGDERCLRGGWRRSFCLLAVLRLLGLGV